MTDSSPNLKLDFVAITKESAIAALVALGLSICLIGLRTVNQQGGLGLLQRWDMVAYGVIGVFIGRFILAWRRETKQRHIVSKQESRIPSKKSSEKIADYFQKFGMVLVPLMLIFAFTFPFLGGTFSTRYFIDVATYVGIYVMLGWGLNIVVGLAGLLDLGYVAFYAVGAYSYALFASYMDWSFWACLPMAGLIAAVFGMTLGFPVLRLRGDYLAIVTLGFGEIIRIILLNWYELTGGPDGLSGIPRPSFLGWSLPAESPKLAIPFTLFSASNTHLCTASSFYITLF